MSQQQLRTAITSAHRHLQQGQPQQCIAACDAILAQHPALLTARQLRGFAALQAGQTDAAIEDLIAVLGQQPGNVHARLSLASAYRRFGRYELCLDTLEPLLANESTESAARLQAELESARAAAQLKSRPRAVQHYEAALALKPDLVSAWAGLASVKEKLNDLDGAREAADRALSLSRDHDLANLTRATVDRRDGQPEPAMQRLERVFSNADSANHRYLAGLQLARCHADLGQHGRAWEVLQGANHVMISSHGDPASQVGETADYSMDTIRSLQTASRQKAPSASNSPANHQPVFFLGFPRSGTTLMDQMLSGHPCIEVIEERELLLPAREALRSFGQPQDWLQLDDSQLQPAREAYMEALEHWRENEGSLLIDKQPLNAAYLPIIQRLFPKAKILLALRDPRDVILSCLFQPFDLVGAMPYFLEPSSAVDYYDAVMRIVMDYKTRFANWHSYRYEDLTHDREPVLRGILNFLDLDWDAAVLRHEHQARRKNIATPSYANVVKPVYQHAAGRWRQYNTELAPWIPDLNDWAERLGYRPE